MRPPCPSFLGLSHFASPELRVSLLFITIAPSPLHTKRSQRCGARRESYRHLDTPSSPRSRDADSGSDRAYDPISNATHQYKSEVPSRPSRPSRPPPLHISHAQMTWGAACDGSSAQRATAAVHNENA
ncbi:hypothetical protein B0H19DRAFT_1377134 [Mycena capillaripes]|nr:hypothetical protein B0H19DRAFT_1377134 [Mycena capillaripes]